LVDGTEKLIIENAELPILSPDGEWIIYYSTESLDWIFFHVESGVEFLFPFRGSPWGWSPDGKWLTITKSYDDRNGDIYLLDMSWLEMEWEE
jgi:Tol biopolymer transport system component